MKRKGWRFRLMLMILAGMLIFLAFSLLYIGLSPIYKPVNIAVSGIGLGEGGSVRFIGEKPLFGEYVIPASNSKWQGETAFYKSIRVELPSTWDYDSLIIHVEAGGDIQRYLIKDLTPANEKNTEDIQTYLFPKTFASPGSLYEKAGLFFGKMEVVLTGLLIIIMLLLLLFYRTIKTIFNWFLRQLDYLQTLAFNISQNRKRLLMVCTLFVFILFVGLGLSVNFSNLAGTSNLPDSYDYQAIAVNYAIGNEFPVSGIIYPIEKYKFDTIDAQTFYKLRATAGFQSLYRAPVFSLFCGLVYKVFGIHPAIIKYILLFLLCFTGALLIWNAARIFGAKGLLAGLMAGLALVILNYQYARILSPGEIFVSVMIVTAFFLSYNYFQKPALLKVLLLGMLFAVSWLTTYSMMLIPAGIMIWLLLLAIKLRSRKRILHLSVFIASMVLTIMPWQIFSNTLFSEIKPQVAKLKVLALDTNLTHSEKVAQAHRIAPRVGMRLIPDSNFKAEELRYLHNHRLPFTRQNGYYPVTSMSEDFNKMAMIEDILASPDCFFLFLPKPNHEALSCHNEFVTEGRIAQDWRLRDCYYTRQDTLEKNDILRIAGFYSENPILLFNLSADKLLAAFYSYKELIVLFSLGMGVLMLKFGGRQRKRFMKNGFMVSAGLVIFLTYSALHFIPWVFVLVLFLFSLSMLITPCLSPSKVFDRLSGLFFLNYVLIILIAYGAERYLRGLQFLMLFYVVYLLLIFIDKIRNLRQPIV